MFSWLFCIFVVEEVAKPQWNKCMQHFTVEADGGGATYLMYLITFHQLK